MHEVGTKDASIRMARKYELVPPVSLHNLEYFIAHLILLQSSPSNSEGDGHDLNSNNANVTVIIMLS